MMHPHPLPASVLITMVVLAGCGRSPSQGSWSSRYTPDPADCPDVFRIHPQTTSPLSTTPRFEWSIQRPVDPSTRVFVYAGGEEIPGTQGFTDDTQRFYAWSPDEPLPMGSPIEVDLVTCGGELILTATYQTFDVSPVPEPDLLDGVFIPLPADDHLIDTPPAAFVDTWADLDPGFAPFGTPASPLVQLDREAREWTALLALGSPDITGVQDLCQPTATVPVAFDNPFLVIEPFQWDLSLGSSTSGPVQVRLDAVAEEPPAFQPFLLSDVAMELTVPLADSGLCESLECRPCAAPGGCVDVALEGWRMQRSDVVSPLVPRTLEAIESDPSCP